MLSSFLNNNHRAAALAGYVTAAALGAGSIGGASAAQYFFQPGAELSAETNSNIELDPIADTDQVEGYIAEVSGVLGIATPRSETTIVPRLQYQSYPDLDEANRLQGDLGVASSYESERSKFQIFGGYEYRDELNAELSEARFDELNPGQSLSPETGRVRPGATRGILALSPTYEYKLTERTGVGASGTYQGINYSPDDTVSFIDFDFYRGDVFLSRMLSQRAELSFSPYVAKYDARNIDSQTDSIGGSLGLEMKWSQTLIGKFNVSYEQVKIDQTQPVVNKETVSAWGADFNLTRRGEISDLILSLGRTVTPSGGGSLYNSDQLQVQYDRKLSQRMSLLTAARYIREGSLSDVVASADRDYAQADIGLVWKISPTWYVGAAYQYIFQEYESESDSAENHKLQVSIGYKGLDRQRQ